ncbi:hypothetical protein DNTS_002664 [Danionella cerebrum]|uniref:EMI domain-containing protein n=1 Tax=Danionella cerebrum TaxID=2873325 RepID=A0A553QKM3_9TELE|nr:hypothetical protein DNTS_002664 [Danionella translucida]
MHQGLLVIAHCEIRPGEPEDELKDMADWAGWDPGALEDVEGLNKLNPDIHEPAPHGQHDANHKDLSLEEGTVEPSSRTESMGSLHRTGLITWSTEEASVPCVQSVRWSWVNFSSDYTQQRRLCPVLLFQVLRLEEDMRIPGQGRIAGGKECQRLPSCQETLICVKQRVYRDVHPLDFTAGSDIRHACYKFAKKRAVTVAVACGTEKYTIKSQSPCPNGTPDCQLVMYKLSTRPVYRQKQKIFTALQWRCCPGHSGANCEEMGFHKPTRENSEQNDYQMFGGPLYEAQQPDAENQTSPSIEDYEHIPHAGHPHHHFERRGDVKDPGLSAARIRDPHVPYPQTPYLQDSLLPILKESVMSQLHPVLENFNRTLERLFQEVQGLQQDMAQLRHDHRKGRVAEPLELGGEDHNSQEAVEVKMWESLKKVEEVEAQFHSHRNELETKLHEQQTMLHYNLTNFKTDMDEQKEVQKIWHENKIHPIQSHESAAVWEAITRLDNKVINNTMRLGALTEGQEQGNDNIRELQNGWRDLDEKILQTGRNSQVQFMETGLEVEAAKVTVLDRISEVSNNMSVLQRALQEMETDVDYLYTEYYKNISSASGDCDCVALGTSVMQLEQTVANVNNIANENKLARESVAQEISNNRDSGAWIPSVEDLKIGLLNVQRSLAFEQEKSRLLQHNVTQLQASFQGSQQDIEMLQEQDRAMVEKIQHLHSIFNTLLQDAIRHSEVLEILLREEVLEFMDWPHQEQRRYAIPELIDKIKDMQKQINAHSLSLASMLNSATPQLTAADEPSMLADWASGGTKRKRGDNPFQELQEYSDTDFWTLEKTVKELKANIKHLEEHRCSSCNNTETAATCGMVVELRGQMESLRKDLETHIGIFKSIFSNAEGFADAEGSVDLGKLLALIRRKEGKQLQNKKTNKADKRTAHTREEANLRGKRDAALESPGLRQLPDSPVMFLSSNTDGANDSGTILFENLVLNHGQVYTPKTGIFRAPTSGVYLFVVTLDFGSGPSLAQLKRGEDVVASLRQNARKLGAPATRICILEMVQGEELRLELTQGSIERNNPQDNTFAGLLMLQTT